jgi:hypothetical protein
MTPSFGSTTGTGAPCARYFGLIAVHPNHVDESLGKLLRDTRISSGLSQNHLAKKLRIDPDDIRAYESGVKRVSTGRLLQIAKALGVRPPRFFRFPVRQLARLKSTRGLSKNPSHIPRC